MYAPAVKDPRERFTATVENYRRYRPDYPSSLIDWIVAEAPLRPGARIVDLGCGTGISSRLLAARGFRVVGVDPNEVMLTAAREDGGGVEYLRGAGEALPLADASADAVTSAQAFHWLDLDRALPELRRVLVPGGPVAAFWNIRDERDAFSSEYEALLLRASEEYWQIPSDEAILARTRSHPLVRDLREHEVPHRQVLDREGLFGRAWSSSYVVHGLADRAAFDAELSDLFDRHQRGGRVTIPYRTVVLLFRVGI